MMAKGRRIPAEFWWRSARDTFEKVIHEFLDRATKAEQEENGHECGHTFEVLVRSRGHYGLAGKGPEEHSDANYWDDCVPVQVRAHNLRDALLLAAARPLSDFMQGERERD